MEGKIIEAKFKKNLTAYIIGAIGIISILISLFMARIQYSEDRWGFDRSFAEYLNHRIVSGYYGIDVLIYFWLGTVILIVFSVLLLMMNRGALTITSTGVIGKASFGKQVDLPMNQISAIGLGAFSSITVATSAGRVHFWLIENRNEVHKALNELLVKLQSESKSNTTTVSTPPTSTADELKKYKELLDTGVITQEEFDAKKKQLLGL